MTLTADACTSGALDVIKEHVESAIQIATGPREMEHPYVFDRRIADCETCPLQVECARTECTAYQPSIFNGLMIVVEAPSAVESSMKVPLQGVNGRLINAMLAQSNIERSECYITHATLCRPAFGNSSESFKKARADIKDAVRHCRPRLLTEIKHLQPRVILVLGQTALDALTGEPSTKTTRVKYECPTCHGQRTWKKWGCAKKDCKKIFNELPFLTKDDKPEDVPCDLGCGLPEAAQAQQLALIELKPRRAPKFQARTVKCEDCGGLKTKPVVVEMFKSAHSVGGKRSVAGGVFTASELELKEHLLRAEATYIVPTFDPYTINQKAKTHGQKQIGGQFLASAMLAHFTKVHRLLAEDPVFDLRWKTVTDAEELAGFLRPEGDYALDIETDAKDPEDVSAITCIGFKDVTGPHTVVVPTAVHFPAEPGVPASWAPTLLSDPLIAVILEFLKDPKRRKGMQNGEYDVRVMKRIWGVDTAGYAWDTLIGHNALAPDEPHHLQHIGGIYTDAAPWKPQSKVFTDVAELHEYNAKDVHITSDAWTKIDVELERDGLRQVHDLDMQKVHLGLSMGAFGMPIDREEQLKLGAQAQFDKEVALQKMREKIGQLPLHIRPKNAERDGEWFNPDSYPQLAWALYDPMGPFRLPVLKKTDRGTPSTDKNALLEYADNEFVAWLMDYRSNQKVKATFIDGMPLGADMRLHARWNPIGARTGRWSSSPNFQNWPKWLRAMVKSLEGRIFVGADYSQLEMRVLAALCADPALIKMCRDADENRKLEADYDPHSFVARMTFGETYTSLALKDPNHDRADRKCACETCTRKHLRDVVKRTVYGLNYGGGAETIREAIYDGGYEGPPINLTMIEDTKRAYFESFPGVPVWRDETLEAAERTGYIKDVLTGRQRQFPLRKIDSTVAYNYPIQSFAAGVMDNGALELYRRLPSVDPTARIFALVHDAAYVECAIERAAAVAHLIESCLSTQIRTRDDAEFMPLPATAAIAYDWKSAA